ncbi:hypothetical protein CRENBAI_023113, partial [Crenichthys baileyi]
MVKWSLPLSSPSLPNSFHAPALLHLHPHRFPFLLESISGSLLILQPNVDEVAQPSCQFLLPLPRTGSFRLITPQASSSSSSQLIPPAFFASINALQGSISSLTQHLQNLSSSAATSALSAPAGLPGTQAVPQPLPPVYTLAEARPGSSLGRSYVPKHANLPPRLHSKILQGQYINL